MTVLRDCTRCGFTLPITDYNLHPAGGNDHMCRECAPLRGIHIRVALIATERSLQVIAATALLAMRYTTAAYHVLTGRPWPTIHDLHIPEQRRG